VSELFLFEIVELNLRLLLKNCKSQIFICLFFLRLSTLSKAPRGRFSTSTNHHKGTDTLASSADWRNAAPKQTSKAWRALRQAAEEMAWAAGRRPQRRHSAACW
jgi:hypothetical protein